VIDQPFGPRKVRTGQAGERRLVIVPDTPSDFFDRMYRIALDVGSADNPAEPGADQQDQVDERA
jgi:hypothetical protein